MDNKTKLDECKGKMVKGMSLLSDCWLLIEFEDGSEVEVEAVESLGCRLKVSCDLKVVPMDLFGTKPLQPTINKSVFDIAARYLSTDGLDAKYKEEVLEAFKYLKESIKVDPNSITQFNKIPHFFYEDLIQIQPNCVFHLNDIYDCDLITAIVAMQEQHSDLDTKEKLISLVKENKGEYQVSDSLGLNWQTLFEQGTTKLSPKQYGHP